MKSSATIFLAAFLALSASWAGFVLAPQIQLGRAVQEKETGTEDLYPQPRSGLARRGAEVYRANGCVYCHSQQINQDGAICDVILTDAGTNASATAGVVAKVAPEHAVDAAAFVSSAPKKILTVKDVPSAAPVTKAFKDAGAKTEVRVIPVGPDISRGWGIRRSVAQDYLFDDVVQLGSRRFGPDLSNIGLRSQDVNTHLKHLYAPKLVKEGSTMPAYRFLFEERALASGESLQADRIYLTASGAFYDANKSEPANRELIPSDDARALAAYLVSLKSDAPLFEAPVTVVRATPPPPATNSPAK